MKKFLTLLAVFFLTIAIVPETADAATQTARQSARLVNASLVNQEVTIDRRGEILKKYLERYNSPLAPYAQTFIDEADRYNLDWKWVVSIAGVESYYGQMIPPYSYNGWGFGVYGNNVRRFASWDEGIHVVSEALREDYMNRNGLSTIYDIGSRYAPDPSWATKVTHFIDELTTYEEKQENKSLTIFL